MTEPQFGAEIITQILENDKVISEHKVIAQTYVRAMTALMNVAIKNPQATTKYGIKDTGGTFRDITSSTSGSMKANAGSGVTTFGIVVGGQPTDAAPITPAPVSMLDFNLPNLILHGNTSGKLSYGATTISNPGGGATSFTITRELTNSQLGQADPKDMKVFEIALYLNTSTLFFMVERTVINETINHNPAQKLVAIYHVRAI